MKHYQFLFFGVVLAAVLVLLDIALEHQGWGWTSPDAGTVSGLRYGYLAVICLLCVGSGWLGSKLAKREAVQRRKTQEVDAVWNAILERGPIGIAVLSPKMEQLYYNEKALRQLGLTEKIETGTSAFSVSTQWTVFSQEGEQLSSEERPLARLASLCGVGGAEASGRGAEGRGELQRNFEGKKHTRVRVRWGGAVELATGRRGTPEPEIELRGGAREVEPGAAAGRNRGGGGRHVVVAGGHGPG